MNKKNIFKNILATIENTGDYQACEDGVSYWLKLKVPNEIEKLEKHNLMLNLINLSTICMQQSVLEKDYMLAEKFRKLIFKMYSLDGVDYFESYMIALEYDRSPSERFYLPRRKIIKPFVDKLQRLADGDIEELFLSMPPRVGKLLADSTPILTTQGWKNHGDLKVGDYVYSPDGKPTKVIAVHPKYATTHTVEFTDGTSIKCHFRHEWKVYDRHKAKVVTLETQDMIGKTDNTKFGHENNTRGHRYYYRLVDKEILEGTPQDLKVPPYTLGAWLGDGTARSPYITGDKKDFKHIPSEYLISPINDRLELLAGLLDTGGYLIKKERRYQFTTSCETLKNDFISLISTFGWRVSVINKKPCVSSSGIVGKHEYWVITFNPTLHIPCVLERKKLYKFSKQREIFIKDIYESEPEQGNCITVERDGMYLAGRTLKPTHNTTLSIFFATWLMGKYPQYPNLYCSYSATLTGKFYDGVLEILQDSATYNWDKIFPDRVLPNKNNGLSNAKDQTLNIDKLKHYPTLTCRSLYGTLNGACDVESGILIADDLLSGIEEALNPDRLDTAWGKVDNNMLTRAKQTSRVLWIGTRWSIKDPIGRRLNLLQTDEKFKDRKWEEINIPALDENDESNFNYDFGVGFSTEMFHQRRASFEHNNDIASWLAQYMGQPIEREGTVFDPNRMNFFDELPKEALSLIDWKFCPVDPAFGGGDYVACPICYVFDKKIYVVDVVYNNSDKNITQNAIANKVVRYGVTTCRVEATKSTTSYAEGVKEKLDSKEYKCNIETKPATTTVSKEIRIFEKAPDIMDNFYFLSSGKRSKEYEMFMQNVFSFKQNGNNKHDDAPDSLSMAQEMFEEQVVPKIEIFQRLF